MAIILCLSFGKSSLSAKAYSIHPNDRYSLSTETLSSFNEIMLDPNITWGEIAYVQVDDLIQSDTLNCFLNNERVTLVAKYHSDQNTSYHYIYYESLTDESFAYLSVYDNNIHIDIRTTLGRYRLVSITDSEVAMYKYESDNIIEDAEPLFSSLSNSSFNGAEAYIESLTSVPTIRVLVLYTSAALAMMPGSSKKAAMRNEAYRYINEGNMSFVNSNINARLQLAYLGPTNYDESSHTWAEALNHFYTQGDGYMDEVHTLRNKYVADICVLLVNKNTYCGEAVTIKANASSAFCMVYPHYDDCGYKYSAIHEMGHLIGCRHNYAQDSNTSPYKYGHGYIHCISGSAWSTIMAYLNYCSDFSNHRILYWSNPNVHFAGIATGTTTLENNARVWNERASTVANFKNKSASISYTASNINTQALFQSIEATTQITTGGGYAIESGQVAEMNAQETIRLCANTRIKKGATFRASLVNDNSIYPQFIKEHSHENINEDECQSTSFMNMNATKIIKNGQLFIIRDGKTYSVTGQEVTL